VSHRRQLFLSVVTVFVALLSMIPLELQRRIVDGVLANGQLRDLLLLGSVYLGVILLQGGIKYFLNVYRGRTVEEVARALRLTIYRQTRSQEQDGDNRTPGGAVDRGAIVAMISAEVEDLAGFVGDGISVPLLQAGTAAVVLGYLLWVEPLIAAFGIFVYLPQILVVPLGQKRINFWAAAHARLIRRLGNLIVAPQRYFASTPDAKAARPFDAVADQAFETRIQIYRVKYFLTFFGNFLDAIGPIAVLLMGGALVLRGDTQISTLIVFISGFQKIADPWDQLVSFYRTLSNARIKYRLIIDALPQQP
jgi:ABC-type multidrug transport system fused ATPase/permease subunit